MAADVNAVQLTTTLVAAAVHFDLITDENAEETARMLWTANHTTSDPRALSTAVREGVTSLVNDDVDPAAVCLAVDDYLAAPLATDHQSQAVVWCEALRSAAEHAMLIVDRLWRLDRDGQLRPAYQLMPPYRSDNTQPEIDNDGAHDLEGDVLGERIDSLDWEGWLYTRFVRKHAIDALIDLQTYLAAADVVAVMDSPEVADAVAVLRTALSEPGAFDQSERHRGEEVLNDLLGVGDHSELVARVLDATAFGVWANAHARGADTGEWVARLSPADGFADMPWLRKVPAADQQPLSSPAKLLTTFGSLATHLDTLPRPGAGQDNHIVWASQVVMLSGSIAATLESDLVSAGDAYRGQRILAALTQQVVTLSPSRVRSALTDSVEFDLLRRDIVAAMAVTAQDHDLRRGRMLRDGSVRDPGSVVGDDPLASPVAGSFSRQEPLRSRDQMRAFLDRLAYMTRMAPPGTMFDELAGPLVVTARCTELVSLSECDRLELVVAALAWGDRLDAIGARSAWTALVSDNPLNVFDQWSHARGPLEMMSEVNGAGARLLNADGRFVAAPRLAPGRITNLDSARTLTRAEVADVLDVIAAVPHTHRHVQALIGDVLNTARHTSSAFDADERLRLEHTVAAIADGQRVNPWAMVTDETGAHTRWRIRDTVTAIGADLRAGLGVDAPLPDSELNQPVRPANIDVAHDIDPTGLARYLTNTGWSPTATSRGAPVWKHRDHPDIHITAPTEIGYDGDREILQQAFETLAGLRKDQVVAEILTEIGELAAPAPELTGLEAVAATRYCPTLPTRDTVATADHHPINPTNTAEVAVSAAGAGHGM
ncbi:hypothetical protein ACQP2U_42610 (plasmid) [Nocardia sp. CA-084685]|uniref:hypothetical protein n=1 Tax=Nocardia sp. CA-084685 TaxID=3239970 RepID=UPI003D96D041